ncbi:hypothetical protein [Hoeflea sp.]|uniref:hypothetical protein n=1 Tax=Hoeflea sp. TaxID=1940281 RepID=UPI0019B0796B|nr:hypothetical protein [Hoeflea sp.]MBC7280044.1 hypothetical protein [Hoeflea sp.]
MPNPRVLFEGGKLVVSKTTKDATDPDLPDTDKIFDSNWLFGIQVLGSGVWDYSSTAAYIDFSIPDFGFQPALMLRFKCRPSWSDVSGQRTYEEGANRPNIRVFTGPQDRFFDRTSYVPAAGADRFLSNTLVRINRPDNDGAEIHWLALSI